MKNRINVRRIIDRLHDDCFEAHRGAFWLDERRRVAVAFGNDGHNTDARAWFGVAAIRRLLRDEGGEEIGFATAGKGYSWALVCKLPEAVSADNLHSTLWGAWHRACGLERAGVTINSMDPGDYPVEEEESAEHYMHTVVQAGIAAGVLARHGLI